MVIALLRGADRAHGERMVKPPMVVRDVLDTSFHGHQELALGLIAMTEWQPIETDMTLCARCLESRCHCERYRKRWPKEWAMRDALGYCPTQKGNERRILLDDIDIICVASNER